MGDEAQPPAIWETSILPSALCDVFLEGNSGVPQPDNFLESCLAVEHLLTHCDSLQPYKPSLLPAVQAFTKICQRLLPLRKVDKKSQPEAFEKAVTHTINDLVTLTSTSTGKLWLIPGGWTSSTTGAFGVVHLLALEPNGETFTLITCNPSSSVFHPCQASTESSKMMYKTALRLGGIPKQEMTNKAFWMMLFAQSLTASEFHREEILYDVLLSSIAPHGQLAPSAVATIKDDKIQWRTPQRAAASSYWKSLGLGLRVLLHEAGAGLKEVKRFSLAMKHEIMVIAHHQLNAVANAQLPRDKATLLRHACNTLANAAVKALDKEMINAAETKEINLLIESVLHRTIAAEAPASRTVCEAGVSEGMKAASSRFDHFCVERKEDEKLAGLVTHDVTGSPTVAQESAPKQAETVEDAVASLVECESFITALASSGDTGGIVSASYTSRAAVDRLIIAHVRSCVVRTVRLPLPLTDSSQPLINTENCLWSSFPSQDLQLTCLAVLHRLMLAYGDAWQSVDDATRALETERCIVALALFSVFDRVVRVQEQSLALAVLLAEDGGMGMSTSLCVANLSLLRVAATMEVNDPGLARVRSECLAYVRSVEQCCARNDLFILRMPTDQIEMKKYSTTVLLLRRVLEQFGYPLFTPMYGGEDVEEEERPEMELLMQWMFSNSTILAKDHPEWRMLRDVTLLFKYLATMETRQCELMRQRIPVSEYQSWALTFGDGRDGQNGHGDPNIGSNTSSALRRGMGLRRRRGGGGGLRMSRAGGLSWEVMGYRGQEMDIADVQVTGFGGRRVFFGEGPVVHSPADVSALLSVSLSLSLSSSTGVEEGQRVTEDDVLHCADLPTFDGTLSHQEAETLLSYLTVPYVRIPLVLGFFAAGDRVTYLFNRKLQRLLRAALFDCGGWRAIKVDDAIATVPVENAEGEKLFTYTGLMANELAHSPHAVLHPLLRMLQALDDFAESSLYSSDAPLLFFLIQLAIDVNRFVMANSTMKDDDDQRGCLTHVLNRKAKPLLTRWLVEAKDVSAQCVVRSYLALVWSSLSGSRSAKINMLGHVLFVRNWHAFGTTSIADEDQAHLTESSPEQRLLRFLQAYGVDTARITNGGLQRFIRKDNKPLFLRVGATVVRVPNLFPHDDGPGMNDTKTLRVGVPEQRVAGLIDGHRHSWSAFLRHAELEGELSVVLRESVRVALPAESTYSLTQWKQVSTGVYACAADELHVDVHSAELRWRNQGIFPLPDALMQYKDFSTVFNNKQMHCGTVALQQHRAWLHIVGSHFDVIQWDKPTNDTLGLAFPLPLPLPRNQPQQTPNNVPTVWQCPVCTFINSARSHCEMCGSPMSHEDDAEREKEKGVGVEFEGVRFDRGFDAFDEKEVEEKVEEEEAWVLKLLIPVLKDVYKDDAMPYKLLLPSKPWKGKKDTARLVGCVETKGEGEGGEEGEAFQTWKEFIVDRRHELVQVFNLVSSGRQLFKQLCFTSKQTLALHGRLPRSKTSKTAAGSVAKVAPLEPSLQIIRANDTLVPARLLNGTLPDALLDNYRFWVGTDGVTRGEPLDPDSTFFAHPVHILPDRRVVRLHAQAVAAKASASQRLEREGREGKQGLTLKRPGRVDVAEMEMEDEDDEEMDEAAVLQLCALGFAPEAAATALRRCGKSTSMAADWLLNPDNAALVNAAPKITNQRWRVIAHKDVPVYPTPTVESSSFGFGLDMSRQRRSLRFGQVVRVKEVAGNWVKMSISGEDRPGWTQVVDADGRVQLEVCSSGLDEASVEQEVKRRRVEEEDKVVVDSDEGDQVVHEEMTLVNLLDPGLEGLVSQLVQVEDLSNVLAWSDDEGVRVVELPRLKIRLAPNDGKLFVMDYAGWFLSSKQVGLLCGEGLVLENGRGEVQVLVGSHPLVRPRLESNAFPLDLVHLRGSQEWLDTMDTRFFLFPVHSSGTFVHCEALSASLYLVLLHLLKRNYANAFEMAAPCTTDTAFSTEEAFIWKQLKQTCDDRHPDAHACRLKLALCTLYMADSSHILPMELHLEYDAYLAKLPRVSLSCRLSVHEELRIAKACATGLASIRNRVNVLMRNDANLVAIRLRNGGLPWVRLSKQSAKAIADTAVGLKRVQLDVNDRSVVQVVLHDLVISDQESGSNRHLGFAYLYDLLVTKNQPHAANLLARSLHLKLCRWGKQEGEEHVWTSKAMAHLIVLITTSDLQWPPLPTDAASKDLLRRGVNLYDAQGRVSAVKAWVDQVDQVAMAAWERSRSESPSASTPPKPLPTSALTCLTNEPIRPDITDTSCKQRELKVDWAGMPLQEIAMRFTKEMKSGIRPSSDVPFDLSSNPASSTVVARELLTRLKEDVKRYAALEREATIAEMVFNEGDDPSHAQCAIATLRTQDRAFITTEITSLQHEASRLRHTNDEDEDLLRLKLQRHACQRREITVADLTRALLDANGAGSLQGINPTLSEAEAEALLQATAELLLRCNRVSQASRAEESVRERRYDEAAKHLRTCRHYLLPLHNQPEPCYYAYDPRYLVFEYSFDLLLRERQVEIVQSFAGEVDQGVSHVQQMIMGAGKTTVVGPLLTLLLADGDSFVTHVMPTALLEQSKQVLRSRFSSVVSKPIYTLRFDRTVEDSQEIAEEILGKLELVRESKAVLCCAPEAIKSLFLKVVEHMSVLHQVDMDILRAPTGSGSGRKAKTMAQLRAAVQRKSDMADVLTKIIQLWKRGILIMDEVDVLLHPLRSELNFPIGAKDPIDLAGYRWELPVFLLDHICQASSNAGRKTSGLGSVIEGGYNAHALQRNPHLVLLDPRFYHDRMLPLLAKALSEWLDAQLDGLLMTARAGNDGAQRAAALEAYLLAGKEELSDVGLGFEFSAAGDHMKLLNLGRDWLQQLLPHVLAKIHRVSFGVLREDEVDERGTVGLSRRLMAVPFVGKDVPSRSSEFAHPDVLIGLTVLGYRYAGLRLSDLRLVVTQLKTDLGRQVGPTDERLASVTFRQWVEQGRTAEEVAQGRLPVVPLPLFQVQDSAQLRSLHERIRKLPDVIHYYLTQHVFPATMNFQKLKISASGHELGSSLLFMKRIGFSGTPSNLLPKDLGTCRYEPGSDGRVLHVLSSPKVVTWEEQRSWTAKSLLRDIAQSPRHFHALIDTGALITGMDNEQVARFLLEHLPEELYEGVVFLDRGDRKMFLQRASMRCVPLSQCGVRPVKRFTFYDQVHTTGMDIKQAEKAGAVVTIGKDMTWRDYAQGAFRMRGVGNGQTIHLYLIEEIVRLIQTDLGKQMDTPHIDVAAWLTLNAIKQQAVQSIHLTVQEIHNVWRKQAVRLLLSPPPQPTNAPASQHLLRFVIPSEWQQQATRALQLFLMPVTFELPLGIPQPRQFSDEVEALVKANVGFAKGEGETIAKLVERVKSVASVVERDGLDSEVVHEHEHEHEEEAEEEAEEEQQRVSAFTRDDEQPIPWSIAALNLPVDEAQPFYPLHSFRVRPSQPALPFPPNLLVSDNFFRPKWVGLGDRKLKTAAVLLEWTPGFNALQQVVPVLHSRLMDRFRSADANANAAAALALNIALGRTGAEEDQALREKCMEEVLRTSKWTRMTACVSLAEAETLKRVLHTPQALQLSEFALRNVENGTIVAQSMDFPSAEEMEESVTVALACVKFVNNEMYFTEPEVLHLVETMEGVECEKRKRFFEDCLRLRRRQRQLWGDTPIAKVFVDKSEWSELRDQAVHHQIVRAFQYVISKPSFTRSPLDLFRTLMTSASNESGSPTARGTGASTSLTLPGFQRYLESFKLGFSAADLAIAVRRTDTNKDQRVDLQEFCEVFQLTPDVLRKFDEEVVDMEAEKDRSRWQCSNCTYINFPFDNVCEVCGMGFGGTLHVPSDKWMCEPAYGGCTFFNPKSQFYCEICNRARPDLAKVRF